MKKSKDGNSAQLAAAYTRLLKVFAQHHVLKTHQTPKPIFEAEATFKAETLGALEPRALCVKVAELIELIADFAVAEVAWSDALKPAYVRAFEPLRRLLALVKSGGEITDGLISEARNRIADERRQFGDVVAKAVDIALEQLGLIQSTAAPAKA